MALNIEDLKPFVSLALFAAPAGAASASLAVAVARGAETLLRSSHGAIRDITERSPEGADGVAAEGPAFFTVTPGLTRGPASSSSSA